MVDQKHKDMVDSVKDQIISELNWYLRYGGVKQLQMEGCKIDDDLYFRFARASGHHVDPDGNKLGRWVYLFAVIGGSAFNLTVLVDLDTKQVDQNKPVAFECLDTYLEVDRIIF